MINHQQSCSPFCHQTALPHRPHAHGFFSHQELQEGACSTEERGQRVLSQSRSCVCPAPILLGSLLEMSWHTLLQQGTVEVSGAAHVTPKHLPGFLHSQAAIPVCHIISRTELRAVHPRVSISLPRGCDEFAAGDLWQFVLGKCCVRPGTQWLRETINSLHWEAYCLNNTDH